eukprot:14000654-Alexandrium_andersonii.AAC.1
MALRAPGPCRLPSFEPIEPGKIRESFPPQTVHGWNGIGSPNWPHLLARQALWRREQGPRK